MSKKSSDWYVPSDLACLLGLWIILPGILILTTCLLTVLECLKEANALDIFYSALALGCFGIVLLFLARSPLYRQRRFWTFGPSALPNLYPKLYWLAYLFVFACVSLLAVVWLKVR